MPVTAQTLVLAGQGIVKLVVRHAREETRLQGHLRLATMASCVRDGKLEREQMPGGLLFLLSEFGHRVLSCGRLLALLRWCILVIWAVGHASRVPV